MRGEVERVGGGGRTSADEIAIALLSGGAANFVGFPIALLALFAAIIGCWSGAASADKIASVGAGRS
jgi:hypothetical protein